MIPLIFLITGQAQPQTMLGIQLASEIPAIFSIGPCVATSWNCIRTHISAGYSLRPYFVIPFLGEGEDSQIHGIFTELGFQTDYKFEAPSCGCLGINPLFNLKVYRFFYSPQGMPSFTSVCPQIGLSLSGRDSTSNQEIASMGIYSMVYIPLTRENERGGWSFGLSYNLWIFKWDSKSPERERENQGEM